MRFISLLIIIPFLSGCYLTQAGAVRELSQERTSRYQAHLTAQQNAVAQVVQALQGMDRGGMKLELTDDGRVKSISYTEPLNVEALTKMAQTQAYREEPVKGVLEEVGDFVMKATNLAVPFASIYYGHKNHIETQRANVRITDSNNQASTAMWGAFTSTYQNSSVITDTSVTELTDIQDYSTDTYVTDIQDYSTDTSVTETTINTSVTELTDIQDYSTNTSTSETVTNTSETVDSSNNTETIISE